MIAFINGMVHAYGLDWVILENNGIGYRIFFAHPELVKLKQTMLIYTYQHVREDEISLFGFPSLEEYDLFIRLISVKGLGPKTAMGILGVCSVKQLFGYIEQGDVTLLRKMPGIGPKTASQIILDLKGKLVQEVKNEEKQSDQLHDALIALKSLGYKANEIQSITKELSELPEKTTDQYVKLGLQYLLKKKGG